MNAITPGSPSPLRQSPRPSIQSDTPGEQPPSKDIVKIISTRTLAGVAIGAGLSIGCGLASLFGGVGLAWGLRLGLMAVGAVWGINTLTPLTDKLNAPRIVAAAAGGLLGLVASTSMVVGGVAGGIFGLASGIRAARA